MLGPVDGTVLAARSREGVDTVRRLMPFCEPHRSTLGRSGSTERTTKVTTANASASIVPTTIPGIVRVFVPTGLELSKTELRNIAAKAAGTINVGRVPAGKPAKLHGVTGHGYDFAPVQRRQAGEAAPDPVVPTADPRIAVLAGLGLSPEQIAAALAAAPAAAAAKGKTTAKATTAKAPREVPAFLRKWENVTCKSCRDFGKVRGPGAGEKAGRAFRTQHGADSAPTAVPCPQHVTAGVPVKGRKAKTA